MNITWNAQKYTSDFSFVHKYGEGVMQLLDLPEGASVLDLGCGNGALSALLAEKEFRVTGMDSSPEQLAIAREKHPGIEFLQSDATDFTLPEPVDAVFANAVFHWIDPEKQPSMLRCIFSALKPGGQLVFEMGGSGNCGAIHAALSEEFQRRGLEYDPKKYFPTIGLEVYPMNVDEYQYLNQCGADFVTVFQETYHLDCYEKMHQAGAKRCMPYRFYAQERAILGGMRGVGFGALLGLSNFRSDMFAAGYHAYLLQKKYPHAEIAMSFPRLRPYKNHEKTEENDVHETQLLQMMLAVRIFLPFASITISTRERAGFRDHVLPISATKISAGVNVGIGGHTEEEQKGDAQFEISDGRSLAEIHQAILEQGMQPVYTDYINTNLL